MKNIWVMKGILLGLGFFVVGALIYLNSKLGPLKPHKATSITLMRFLTIDNPFFWAGLVVAVVAGCAVVKFWPHSG